MIKSEGFAAINSKFSSVTMFAGMTCVRRDLPSVSVPVYRACLVPPLYGSLTPSRLCDLISVASTLTAFASPWDGT
jgi:hypothetical protein